MRPREAPFAGAPAPTRGSRLPAGAAVGIPWFEPHDYDALRAFLDEEDDLPASFDIWQRRAAMLAAALAREGYRVFQVRITPADLAVWCREQNVRATFRACIDLAEARGQRMGTADG